MPAVGHGSTCELCAFRGTALTHRRVDSYRPLVHAFGIGVGEEVQVVGLMAGSGVVSHDIGGRACDGAP